MAQVLEGRGQFQFKFHYYLCIAKRAMEPRTQPKERVNKSTFKWRKVALPPRRLACRLDLKRKFAEKFMLPLQHEKELSKDLNCASPLSDTIGKEKYIKWIQK